MEMDGLRIWAVRGYPHQAVYLETLGGVKIVRVLHAARDFPVAMRE